VIGNLIGNVEALPLVKRLRFKNELATTRNETLDTVIELPA